MKPKQQESNLRPAIFKRRLFLPIFYLVALSLSPLLLTCAKIDKILRSTQEPAIVVTPKKLDDKTTCEKWEMTSDEFQEIAKHPKRSLHLIKNILSTRKDSLLSFFNSIDTILKDTSYVFFSIDPSGRYSVFKIDSLKHKIDSISLKRLFNILNKIKLDSIPNYDASLKILALITKTDFRISIAITDSIEFFRMRTMSSIRKVVMAHLKELRYAYNERLRTKPGYYTRIEILFAIDENGKVIYTKIAKATFEDEILENKLQDLIRQWRFCPIPNKGDVTEVIYPFVFSM